jgi:FkbM family methyltransferase
VTHPMIAASCATLRERLPAPVRRRLHLIRIYLEARTLVADAESRAIFWPMVRDLNSRPPEEPQAVAIRALGGESVWLRPGTVDAEVALSAFVGQYHLPPAHGDPPRMVWDLGCNIGLTVRHMATLYPQARIVGVELSAENLDLARRNVEPYAARCALIHGAVWSRHGEVRYDSSDIEAGYKVNETGDRTVTALTLNELLDRTGPPDYVKTDIEGAERVILSVATEWAQSVRTISVECHPPYSMSDCRRDLEALGFAIQEYPRSFRRRATDCVVGVRPYPGAARSAASAKRPLGL